jgi:hypothetical protein
MDVLVSLGTNAAYLYSVAALLLDRLQVGRASSAAAPALAKPCPLPCEAARQPWMAARPACASPSRPPAALASLQTRRSVAAGLAAC